MRGLLRSVLLLPMLAWLAACGSSVSRLPAAPATSEIAAYRLGSADTIKVTVFGEPDLSGSYELDSLGRFAMPLIDEVDAQGATVRELESRIAEKLRASDLLKDPAVNVAVLTYRPFFILGEVKVPGSYHYAAGTTVVRAVALAGGFTYRANENAIKLTRGDGTLEEYRAELTTPILPGDIIEVEERFF